MFGATAKVIDQDVALNAALARNLDGCFEQLVAHYECRLYCFALRLSGNAQDAEEIVQDAFVRAYHALERYPADQITTLAIRPWLYQITLNVLRNRVRGQRIATTPIDDLIDSRALTSSLPQPDVLAERAERRRELTAVLASLPDRFRVAVVLRHVEGFSYPELADLLDQPIGTIKANVHRGLKVLKHSLEQTAAKEDQ